MEETTSESESILDELFALNYNHTSEIIAVEQRIYEALQRDPGRIEGLITLMFAQIMLGNHAKAKALANKIWEVGGSLSEFFELLYINNLLNLGLLEMASVLVKPRFENLSASVEAFYPVLVKFAVITGSLSLLQRLQAFPAMTGDDLILYDFANFYSDEHRSESFKNVQKLILENSGEALQSYEYNLYDENGYPELEIVLYVIGDGNFAQQLEKAIETKISAFYRSIGVEQLSNHYVSVESIQNHLAWNSGDEEPVSVMDEGEAAAWGQIPHN